MPIKEESIIAIEKLAQLEPGQLELAIKSDTEVEIKVPEGKLFTDADLVTYKENVIKDNQGTYEEAKKAGWEMKVKELKQEHGYEFEGKEVKALLEHHAAAVLKEADKEPDKKIGELEGDLTKVRGNWDTDKIDWDTKEKNYLSTISDFKIGNQIAKYFPQNDTMSLADQMLLFKNYHTITEEDGVLTFSKDGKPLKDTMQSPLTAESVIGDWVAAKGWGKKEGRKDGLDYKGTKFENMNDVIGYLKTNKIDLMSEEGKKMIDTYQAKFKAES